MLKWKKYNYYEKMLLQLEANKVVLDSITVISFLKSLFIGSLERSH